MGYQDVIRELMQHRGIDDEGDKSHGLHDLGNAAEAQEGGIMTLLVKAGVADTGDALLQAAAHGGERSVKFLLQQQQGDRLNSYVNAPDSTGATPLTWACHGICSPRVVRVLVDAGASTTSPIRVVYPDDGLYFDGTLLEFVHRILREEAPMGEDATEKQLKGIEGIRRLLLQVDAVDAVS